MGIRKYPAFVTQRAVERFTQRDANVFHCVVLVNI
jgi:hypothetical protein